MARCEHCGNEYDKSFTVTMDEQAHTFDSFECAIATLAPRCAHCDCAIIGHGVESESGRGRSARSRRRRLCEGLARAHQARSPGASRRSGSRPSRSYSAITCAPRSSTIAPTSTLRSTAIAVVSEP